MKNWRARTRATESRFSGRRFWRIAADIASGFRPCRSASLYEGCREAVMSRGGEVRLRCGVREIRIEKDAFAGAILEDGSEVAADACIVAVPHDALLDLAAEGNGRRRAASRRTATYQDIADHRRASLVRPQGDEGAVS